MPDHPAPGQPPSAAQQELNRIRGLMRRLRSGEVAFDSHVLIHFPDGGVLPLMRRMFSGRLHLAFQVNWEVKRGWEKWKRQAVRDVIAQPEWFDVFRVDETDEVLEVEDLRSDWGAKHNEPVGRWDHIGEAETLVKCRQTKWLFITNDGDAVETAATEGYRVPACSPGWILIAFVAEGWMTADQAWDAYEAMRVGPANADGMGEWTTFPATDKGKERFLAMIDAVARLDAAAAAGAATAGSTAPPRQA